MELFVIIAQRKCGYPGEYAPEALCVVDYPTMDENPEYLEEQLSLYRQEKDFESVEIIRLNVDDNYIDTKLGLLPPEEAPHHIISDTTPYGRA